MSELKNLRELFSKANISRVISIDDCHIKDAKDNELKAFLDKVSLCKVACTSLSNIPYKEERDVFLATQDGKTLWLVDNEMYDDSDAGEKLIIELILRTAYTDDAYRNIYALTSWNVSSNQIDAFRQRVSEALEMSGGAGTFAPAIGGRSPFPDEADYDSDFRKLTNPDAPDDETFEVSAGRMSVSAEKENQSQRGLSYFACIVEKRLLTGDLSEIAETEDALCEQIIRGVLDNCSVPLLQYLSGIYSSAAKEAENRILPFGSDTVYRIFFESGKDEGIMPTDMIQRFLTSILRKNVSDQIARDYDNIAERIDAYRKAVEAMPPTFKDKDDYAQVLEVRTAECYDTSVNGRYLPPLSGDIFLIGSDKAPQYYLLLGQACNLTVRDKNGRAAQCATLAKITIAGKSDSRPDTLNYFWNVIGGKKNDEWRVDFNQTINVDFNALDLCSLNADGEAKAEHLNETGALDSPFRYPRSIRKRLEEAVAHNWKQAQQYKAQCERFKRLKGAYESKDPNIAEILGNIELEFLDFSKIAASVREIYSDNSLNVVPDFGDGSVTYNIRRLARLSEAYTDKILREYANYHSRKAVDFDYAKFYQEIRYEVQYRVNNSKDAISAQELTAQFPNLNVGTFPLSSFVYHQHKKDSDLSAAVREDFEQEFKDCLPSNGAIRSYQVGKVSANPNTITVIVRIK